jgi:heme-degrading monooxygenase HmoA
MCIRLERLTESTDGQRRSSSGSASTGDRSVICRLWRGWTTPDNAAAYEAIVRGEVIPEIETRHIPGFLSIDLMRRSTQDGVEFATIMWFDDLDAVKAFVGEDYELAHVPERARNVLARFDKRSVHFEVLDRRDQARF